jgi:hypothetical protein
MNLRTLRLTAVSMLAALPFIAACTEKDADVEAQDPAIAKQIVDQYAQATLASTGQDKFSQCDIGSMPCEGRLGELSDTVYTMYGVYQLLVPADEQTGDARQGPRCVAGTGLHHHLPADLPTGRTRRGQRHQVQRRRSILTQ